MTSRLIGTVLLVCLATGITFADEDGDEGCRIDGSWLLNVQFDSGLRFQQLLSFHRGGTVTETNSGLHATSYPDPNLPPDPNGPPPFNGSDGHGSWTKMPGCRVQWSFLKFVYAGPELGPPLLPMIVRPGQPVGFLRVRSLAQISGGSIYTVPGTTVTELVFGPDPNSPFRQDFGQSNAFGYRLLPTD